MIAGWLWEQNHRRRRQAASRRGVEASRGDDVAAAEETTLSLEDAADSPVLRLVPESAATMPSLEGRKLRSIRFFSDAIELDFGGAIVTTNDNPVIVTGLQRLRYPDPGSRDALCMLIGAPVEAARAAPGERIEIRFSADRQLIVQHARSRLVTIVNRS